MTTASDFYPTGEQHYIATFPINLDTITPEIRLVLPKIYALATLGDAINALQMADGNFLNTQAADLLLYQSADLLSAIAASFPDPLAEVLRLRAANLSDKKSRQAAILQVDIPDDALVLLCGLLATWRGKSRQNRYAVVASVPIAGLNKLIHHADKYLEPALQFLRQLLDTHDLEIGHIPSFVVTDLIACGGEASTYPRQFSYFLPEDEGVKSAQRKRTIVYANLYVERFQHISLLLAKRILLSPQQREVTSYNAQHILLLWFRGHDIGHSFRLPETDYKRLRLIGLERSMILQEAIADVLGYLLLLSDSWQQAFQLNPDVCNAIFLAEMLRYIRRGPVGFVDSEAAFIELSYLVSHNYISITQQGEKLFWQSDRLHIGMVALAQELITIVLRSNREKADALFIEHSFHDNHSLSSIYKKLVGDFGSIPTDVAYYNSQISERET